ncbi:MAG: hypothetical protein JWR26_3409 [Pedosphaera sp.]|nr:hypothetical protein [Pedosphaera sp.]
MKDFAVLFSLAICCLFFVNPFASAQGTAFTYQGQLQNNGIPATGSFDLQFELYDSVIAGNQIGSGLHYAPVVVTNGLFTLQLDFGTNASAAGCWLEIGVRSNGSAGAYSILIPRQAITPAPHAIFADTSGASPAANLTGTLPASVFPATSMALQSTNNPQFYGGVSYGGNFQVTGWLYLDPFGNAAMRWNGAHPGGGELEITSQGSISLNAGYNGQAISTLQIGSSGSYHEQVNFQWDQVTDSGHPLGYSKNVRFKATYWDGTTQQFKHAGMRHEMLDTNGNSQLTFYNPSPEVSGWGQGATYSGGIKQGAVLTNGWELDGKITANLNSAKIGAAYAINFNGARYNQVLLTAPTTTFSAANLPANGTVQEMSLDIYPELGSKTLVFPPSGNGVQWIWRNEAGTLTAPTTLASGKVMFLKLKISVSSFYTNIDAGYTLGSYSPNVDADASTFIAAASITDSIQQSAVNQLCLDLKASGLWTKMDALYPFVGGNATAHSKNLKDTTHYNITWNGSVTHDTNGVTGDGATGYGDTGFDPTSATSPNFNLNSASLGVYSRTASPANTGGAPVGGPNFPTFIGCFNNGGASIYYQSASGNAANHGINNSDAADMTTTYGTGLEIITRTGANAEEIYSGGHISTASFASTSLHPGRIYICAENSSGLWHPSNANLAFAFIGSGLNSSDITALNSAVTRFETALSRQ